MKLEDLLNKDDIDKAIQALSDEALDELIGVSRNNRMKPKKKPRKGKTSSVKNPKAAAVQQPKDEEAAILEFLKNQGIDLGGLNV